ncbi:MAG TPA: CBO0543 family protein [Bacillota bacterium]|nr:CBO0543 family protein [Bacillota bacterium]
MFFSIFEQHLITDPRWKQLIEQRTRLKEGSLEFWLDKNLDSPAWWTMLGILLILVFVWWKLVDKTRFLEIVCCGLMSGLLFTIVDSIASEQVVWAYPSKLTPLPYSLLLGDLTLLPLIYMGLYQYCRSWKAYLVAAFIAALFLAFVLEPLAVRLEVFQMLNWEYGYSFVLYSVKALFIKWAMEGIKALQRNATN